MLVKFLSDFHCEFWTVGNPVKFERILDKYLPSHPDDRRTVLVCAGDMGTYSSYPNSYKPLFDLLSKRFKHVICIPGNHSWYNSAGIWGNEKEFWKNKKIPKNVSYLDNEVKVIGDVAFIGSCLWTDFKYDPIAMFDAQRNMNDYSCIKRRNYEVHGVYGTVIQSAKLQPSDTVQRFDESFLFLKSALSLYHDKKCVVVTHTAPSEQSVAEHFRGSTLNAAYYTDLSELILTYEPVVWTHGHMHHSQQYDVGSTKVILNPLGYHAVEINKKFDPDLTIDI